MTLFSWCKELTYLKGPWCWERLKAGGEGDDRGWDGWMASSTRGHEVKQVLGIGDEQWSLMCSSSWGHKELDTTEWLNWTELNSSSSSDWIPSPQDPWTWKTHMVWCHGEFWEQPLKCSSRIMPGTFLLSWIIEMWWASVWGAGGVDLAGTSCLWSSWAFSLLGQVALSERLSGTPFWKIPS